MRESLGFIGIALLRWTSFGIIHGVLLLAGKAWRNYEREIFSRMAEVGEDGARVTISSDKRPPQFLPHIPFQYNLKFDAEALLLQWSSQCLEPHGKTKGAA